MWAVAFMYLVVVIQSLNPEVALNIRVGIFYTKDFEEKYRILDISNENPKTGHYSIKNRKTL